jgi:hypothetical protein
MPIINIRCISVAINTYRTGMQVSYKHVWKSVITLLTFEGLSTVINIKDDRHWRAPATYLEDIVIYSVNKHNIY